jgi:hypothetical protein
MDRSNNIVPAIYGYTVCLIAVVLFVAGTVGIVNNVFRTMNPGFEGSRHRMSMRWSRPHGFRVLGQRQLNTTQSTPPDVVQTGSATGVMAQRPNTFRGAMIARARLNAVRALTVSLVLSIISIVLFTGHWRWLNGARPA